MRYEDSIQFYKKIKQNANCPASEKTGEGPGSCGGAKGGSKQVEKISPAQPAGTKDGAKSGSFGYDKMGKKEAFDAHQMIVKASIAKQEARDKYEKSKGGAISTDKSGKITDPKWLALQKDFLASNSLMEKSGKAMSDASKGTGDKKTPSGNKLYEVEHEGKKVSVTVPGDKTSTDAETSINSSDELRYTLYKTLDRFDALSGGKSDDSAVKAAADYMKNTSRPTKEGMTEHLNKLISSADGMQKGKGSDNAGMWHTLAKEAKTGIPEYVKGADPAKDKERKEFLPKTKYVPGKWRK